MSDNDFELRPQKLTYLTVDWYCMLNLQIRYPNKGLHNQSPSIHMFLCLGETTVWDKMSKKVDKKLLIKSLKIKPNS